MFNKLPVIPLDDINDVDGMRENIVKFTEWLTLIPHDEPLELRVRYGAWDSAPRAWSFRSNNVPSSTGEIGHRMVVEVSDAFDEKVLVEAQLDVLPPEDDLDDPQWVDGLFTGVVMMAKIIADLQCDILEEAYARVGWSAETFLSETSHYLSEKQQRAYLQGMWHLSVIDQVVLDYGDEMTEAQRQSFIELKEQFSTALNESLDKKRATLDSAIEDAIERILGEDGSK